MSAMGAETLSADREYDLAVPPEEREVDVTGTSELAPVSRQFARDQSTVRWFIVVMEYAIVASLMLVAAVALVSTMAGFIHSIVSEGATVAAAADAVDGILLVIILIDIMFTVFGHLRRPAIDVRQFLAIGIVAGVRAILSASVHFATASKQDVGDLLELGGGVATVLVLLVGLWLLRLSRHPEASE
jgi:uncharacterized membrane protein (DUF373 family)